MLKGNWLRYAILGGIAALLLVFAGLSIYQVPRCLPLNDYFLPKIKSADIDYGAAAQEAAAWATAIQNEGMPQLPCPDEAKDCAQSYHDALDLKAQWAAAKAALDMTCLNIYQFVVGLIGLAALLISLQLTRDSLAVANESITVTKDTAAHELRPYLGIKSIDWILPENWKEIEAIPSVRVVIENFGQTPAKTATYAATVKVVIPIGIDFSFDGIPKISLGTVMPGQVVFGAQILDYQTWRDRNTAILQQTLHVYCFGRIEYFDPISARTRETFFRALFIPTDALHLDGRGMFLMCPEGNDAT